MYAPLLVYSVYCNLPVVRHMKMEFTDMGGISGQNNVASELSRCEPEWEVWDFIQLELCMNPVVCTKKKTWLGVVE